MAQSPSKRQRVSTDQYISRNATEEDDFAQSTPTTPRRRASYLSPTKASLARSHPNLLARSPRKAVTAPRNRTHTEHDDGERTRGTATRTRVEPRSAPRLSLSIEEEPVRNTGRHRSMQPDKTLAADITQAFKDVPLRAERHETPDLPGDYATSSIRRSGRRPLSQTQPRGALDDETLLKPQQSENALSFVPRLVTRSGSTSGRASARASADVELPPTPVQLGLSAAPDRPRGLASSSSGGSRGGSGRHRRRVRNGESRSITSSPLKPRGHPRRLASPAMNRPTDAPESGSEDEFTAPRSPLSDAAKQRQGELAELEKELNALREDVNKLALLAETLDDTTSLEIDDEVREILSTSQRVSSSGWDTFGSQAALSDNIDTFASLFAPANLQLRHETETKVVGERPKVIHKITVSAPQPWPVSTLSFAFDVTVDAGDARIDSIAQRKSEYPSPHRVLEHWFAQRLRQPLHQYDVGGLVLGAGQYLEACITKAKTLRDLDRRHGREPSWQITHSTSKGLSRGEAISLTRFMDKTQLTLTSPSALAQSRASETRLLPRKEILLTYDLELTWTGNVKPKVSISSTGVGVNAQKSAQELFQKLLKTSSVVKSVDSIWELLECDDGMGGKDAPNTVVGKGRATAKKSRRKVVAGRS